MLILHYNYFNVWYRHPSHTVIEQSNAATNPYFVRNSRMIMKKIIY